MTVGFAVFVNKGSVNKPIYHAAIFRRESAAKAYRGLYGNGIIRQIEMECDRCLRLDSSDVEHHNCMYNGNAIGHSKAHCTATACF